MVLSREGDEREIDVAVYLPAGPRTLVIGVECRGHGRSGTKEWIDGLIGKYDGLPVDKIVAVHERGFTKGALKKAADAHIECVTLGRARQDVSRRVEGKDRSAFRGGKRGILKA